MRISLDITRHIRSKIPLLYALLIPFVALTVVTVGLVGYLSYRNGRRAVNDVAEQLRTETTLRIRDHLRTFLDIPHGITQANAYLMGEGLIDPTQPDVLMRHFWELVDIHPTVTSVYFGNTRGGLVNSGREGAKGGRYVILTDNFEKGPLVKYSAGDHGQPTDVLFQIPRFDATARPWYTSAVEKGSATWSPAYILSTGQDLAVAASRPVYDSRHNLLGVVSVDIFLSHLSYFLKSLNIGHTGQAIIVEQSGLLIASSTDKSLVIDSSDPQNLSRLNAKDSPVPLINGAMLALRDQVGGLGGVTGREHLEFEIQGRHLWLDATPMKNEYGLDWVILVVIPEADFMSQINENRKATAWTIVAALLITLLLGYFVTRKITNPIMRLNSAAQCLAKGNSTRPIPDKTHLLELNELTGSFNRMSSELQQTMEELQHENTERRQAEESLALALAGADLGTWDWSPPTGRLVVNSRWAQMLGYSVDELEPHVDAWRRLVHPDDLEWVEMELEQHLNGKSERYEAEHRLAHKSGGWVWVLDKGKVTERDPDGNPLRVCGTHLDITKRKQAEEERERLQSQLIHAHKMESVGTLAGGIAHDFNNLLQAISGYTQMLLLDCDESADEFISLKAILKASDRAAQLVRQLLLFSRKMDAEKQRLDLNAEVEQALHILKSSIPKMIEVEFDPGDVGGAIEADPIQLEQIILNLGSNAADAMPNGGVLTIKTGNFTLHSKEYGNTFDLKPGSYALLTISDTGQGIDQNVIEHIFEPFYTTKEVGKGTGLGLASAYGIVKSHGGYITCYSEVAQGTTFTIYFPISEQADIDEGEKSSAMLPEEGSGTILIVDDEPPIRDIATQALTRYGYRVITASKGEEALQILVKDHLDIDLVILDLNMPGMGGKKCFTEIMNIDPKAKVLLASGYSTDGPVKDLLEAGARGFIAKPYQLTDLLNMVLTVLDQDG